MPAPNQSLGLAETLYYFKQICDGLSHAHACGVIHRDLKPDNLLLSADWQTIKIADFGVAKTNGAEYSPITRVGTPTYSAPEHSPHLMTEVMGPLTASADSYSLAKTCYTMLCGRAPFEFNGKPITSLPSPADSETWAQECLKIRRSQRSARTLNQPAKRGDNIKPPKELRPKSNHFNNGPKFFKLTTRPQSPRTLLGWSGAEPQDRWE